MGRAVQAAVHVLKVLELRLWDILQYKLLVFGAVLAEVSKLDSIRRLSFGNAYVAR
jgi:hypothetical protein